MTYLISVFGVKENIDREQSCIKLVSQRMITIHHFTFMNGGSKH